jgi:hypothetical protein
MSLFYIHYNFFRGYSVHSSLYHARKAARLAAIDRGFAYFKTPIVDKDSARNHLFAIFSVREGDTFDATTSSLKDEHAP